MEDEGLLNADLFTKNLGSKLHAKHTVKRISEKVGLKTDKKGVRNIRFKPNELISGTR